MPGSLWPSRAARPMSEMPSSEPCAVGVPAFVEGEAGQDGRYPLARVGVIKVAIPNGPPEPPGEVASAQYRAAGTGEHPRVAAVLQYRFIENRQEGWQRAPSLAGRAFNALQRAADH